MGSVKFGRTLKSAAPQRRYRAILSADHEETMKFSSVTGNTHTLTKRLEKDAGYFLSNNKGIAIVITPHMGDLPAHSEVPITVTIYNNICGRFDDTLVSEVHGLEAMEFPVSIGIKGSPIEIPLNQVGVNYNSLPPSLPIST